MSKGKPKFVPGMRVVVANLDVIEGYSHVPTIPMVGWVHHTEERKNGNQHMGWDIYVSRDMGEPLEDYDYVKFNEDEVQRVDLKRYGMLIRLNDAISCPWCLEHGRDPRLEPYYVHPQMDDCQCWHHHHKEHMPDCPYGGSHCFSGKESK